MKTTLKKNAPVLTRVQLKRLNIGELYWNASYDQIPKHAAYKMFVGRYLVKLETVINKGIGLYLWGDNSRGKTYIAAIICKAAVEKGYTAYMILADDLKSAVIERLLFDEDTTVMQRAKDVDILVVEDFGKEYRGDNSNFVEVQFENLLRARRRRKKVTIMTSNMNPDDELQKIYGNSTAEILKEILYPYEIKGKNWRNTEAEKIEAVLEPKK